MRNKNQIKLTRPLKRHKEWEVEEGAQLSKSNRWITDPTIMIQKIKKKGNPVDIMPRKRDIRELGGKKRRQREPLLPKS